MKNLEDKVVVITGGSTGIGLSTAQAFVDMNAQVVITGRNKENLDKALEQLGPKVKAVQGDVSKLEDIDKLIAEVSEQYGKIDVLFANAGIAQLGHVAEVTEEHFDRHFDINVKGLFFTVQKTLPLMSSGSSIILNASIVQQKGMPNMSVYSATKGAVRSLARTLTTDLKDRGIRVNSISPGPIETPIYDKMGIDEEMGQAIVSQVPLGRFGEPKDIADAIVYLGSDSSKYVTGIDLVVDGGLSQV